MQKDNTITRNQESMLIQKIRSLAPDKITEVVDFVDFLSQKDQERQRLQAANKLAEDAMPTKKNAQPFKRKKETDHV